jgi:hypothetical protein
MCGIDDSDVIPANEGARRFLRAALGSEMI